jgi:hypothetical protein
MQQKDQPDTWQQPDERPSQAPFEAAPESDETKAAPIVTLSPEDELAQPDLAARVQHQPENDEPVRWQATEYIQREKNPLWFVLFGVVILVLMALAIFLIKSVTFAVLVPVMAAALLVYSHRPPRVLDYTLSRQGLHINDRLYPFNEFKGFGVIQGDDEYSVLLIPTKRFKPGVSVYFPEGAGEAIVDMLAARLPMEELHLDLIDQLIRKLRL